MWPASNISNTSPCKHCCPYTHVISDTSSSITFLISLSSSTTLIPYRQQHTQQCPIVTHKQNLIILQPYLSKPFTFDTLLNLALRPKCLAESISVIMQTAPTYSPALRTQSPQTPSNCPTSCTATGHKTCCSYPACAYRATCGNTNYPICSPIRNTQSACWTTAAAAIATRPHQTAPMHRIVTA